MALLGAVCLLASTVSLVAALIGLIKPSFVKQSSRARALGIYLLLCAVFLGLFTVVVVDDSSSDNQAVGHATGNQPTQAAARETISALASQPTSNGSESPSSDGLDDILNKADDTDHPKDEPKLAARDRNPRLNFEAVLHTLQNKYSIRPEYNFGNEYCPRENFCEALAKRVHIQAIGHIVTAFTDTRLDPADYVTVCNGILEGLSQANGKLVIAANQQAFAAATSTPGGVQSRLGNVTIRVTPKSNGLLECSYVRMVKGK